MSQPPQAQEIGLFRAWLDQQRHHALDILEGLDEEALRRPLLPSGWNCLGMVRHLADLERFWFRSVVTGDQTADNEPIVATANPWLIGEDVRSAEVFAAYQREIELANAVIAATPLDASPAWWPDFFGDWRLDSFREILFHVMTETACHAGHLDAVRELIDGRQWLVLE